MYLQRRKFSVTNRSWLILAWLERLIRKRVSLQAVWVIGVHVACSPICISDRSDRNDSSDAWPSSKGRFRGLERSGSIAFPDRVHRYIPLVASGPRHYFDLRDDTETELSRGTGSFGSSPVSQGGWNVC